MPSFIWNSMVFSSDLSQEFFIHLSKRILIHHEYFEVGYLSLSVWMVCWLIILSGPMILMVYLLRYAYTQVEIQDLILTYKTGLFFTSIREVDIRDIEELFVNSGVFGTALGYGYVTFFVEGDKFTIPNLNKPQAFINRINYIKSSHRS